jgi:hypothetical protein
MMGELDSNSTLVTDKMNSYVRFTNAIGIELIELKTGKATKGIYAKETDTEKRNIFLNFVLVTLKTDRCRDLSNRPAIPLVIN